MGMKILAEDGAVLHEFADGLGAPLLYRVLAAAKFPTEPDPLIILNPHVAAFYRAIAASMTRSTTSGINFADFAFGLRLVVQQTLYREVLAGNLKWPSWSPEEKQRMFERF